VTGGKAWESTWGYDKEDREPEHRLVFAGVRSWADLLADPPGPGEQGDGWHAPDPTRFGRYARRLWQPLLAHEQVTDR
jgi:exodeoxyribonuclease V gamma subunit